MARTQVETADRALGNGPRLDGEESDRATPPPDETEPDGPRTIASYRERAMSLALLARYREAEAVAREALAIWPDEIDLLNALAVALWRQDRPDQAEATYRRSISIDPNIAYTWTNLGLFLGEQKRYVEAEESFRRALELQPETFIAQMNLGISLSDQCRFGEAAESLQAALALQPESAEALQNIGMNLSRQRRWAEAVEYYERAVQIQPDNPDPRATLGCVLLGAGDYARGWPAYEWRLSRAEHKGARVNRTFWNGDDFRDQTILLHFEQGFGDTLQFVRFAPLVKRRGGRVVLLCQTALVRLLSRCPGIDLVCDGAGYEPPCHVHAPLMSLPSILGTTLATLPAQVPYVFAESALVEYWRAELARSLGGQGEKEGITADAFERRQSARPFLIGIAWQGHPDHQEDRWRSFRIDEFAPLAEMPGVRLISLQVGAGRDQIESLDGRFRVVDLPKRRGIDFSETAAIMCSLDLVVTPDTAVAHLAGALGITVWVALPYSSEWRWLSGGDNTPWYPTMRLFQQKKPGEWGFVFQRMVDALDDAMACATGPRGESAA
jgi:Tfp pilus assembly protein PilF